MYIMLHAKCKVHGKVGEEPGRFFGGALIFRVGMIFARVMAHCYFYAHDKIVLYSDSGVWRCVQPACAINP